MGAVGRGDAAADADADADTFDSGMISLCAKRPSIKNSTNSMVSLVVETRRPLQNNIDGVEQEAEESNHWIQTICIYVLELTQHNVTGTKNHQPPCPHQTTKETNLCIS